MAIRINDVPPKYRAILEKVDTQPKDGYIVDKEIVPAANAVLSELGVSSSIKPEEAEQFLLRVLDIKPVTLPAPSTGVGGPTISRKINGVTYSLEKTVADDKITYRWCSDETKPFIEITVEDILKDKNLKVLYALWECTSLIDRGNKIIKDGQAEPHWYTNLIDDYKLRASWDPDDEKARNDLKNAETEAKNFLGPDYSLVFVQKKFEGMYNVTHEAERRAYYMALVSLMEVLLSQNKKTEVIALLQKVEGQKMFEGLAEKIDVLKDEYFYGFDLVSLKARFFLARIDIYKAAEQFDQAQKVLQEADQVLPGAITKATNELREDLGKATAERIKSKINSSLGKLERFQEELTETLLVSSMEISLGQKKYDSALELVAKRLNKKVPEIKSGDFASIFEKVKGRRVREDLTLRAGFAFSDVLKVKALELVRENKEPEAKILFAQAKDILQFLKDKIVLKPAEFLRLSVSLAEAYVGVKNWGQAKTLLTSLPQAQSNCIPMVTFKAVPPENRADYFIRANLSLAEIFNEEQKYDDVKKVLDILASSGVQLNSEQEARKAIISLYYEKGIEHLERESLKEE